MDSAVHVSLTGPRAAYEALNRQEHVTGREAGRFGLGNAGCFHYEDDEGGPALQAAPSGLAMPSRYLPVLEAEQTPWRSSATGFGPDGHGPPKAKLCGAGSTMRRQSARSANSRALPRP